MSQPQQQEMTPQQQQIIQRYQQLYQEYSKTIETLSQIEIERKDHEAVLNALKAYEPDRKCYRMINNVLREMKASEVVPQLEEELVALHKKFDDQNVVSKEKGDELNAFKLKHGIRVKGQDKARQQDAGDRQQGVL